MANTDKISEFWSHFCGEAGEISVDEPYQVWHFGNTPEMAVELAELVILGKKTATCSLAAVNELKPEEAPEPDGFSVVTDFYRQPMCVIRTVEIRHMPFNEVDAEFAADEGEGDRTLEYWRQVHRQYFTRESAELGLDFDERSLVCCERFKLLYPK